jgi:hypothetical protein
VLSRVLGTARARRRGQYLTWTEDNLLRQVVYEGLRADKPAAEVRRPVPHPTLATAKRGSQEHKMQKRCRADALAMRRKMPKTPKLPSLHLGRMAEIAWKPALQFEHPSMAEKRRYRTFARSLRHGEVRP